MPFKGQGEQVLAVEAAVEQVVRDEHTFISGARVIGTARKMGLTKVTDRNLARVSAKLQVDALLYGNVSQEDGVTTLKVLVRSGRSGAPVGEPFTVKFKGTEIEGKARKELVSRLEQKVAAAKKARVADEEDEEEDNRRDPDSEDLVERNSDEEEDEGARDQEEEEERDSSLSKLSPEERAEMQRSRAVEVHGGFSLAQRQLKFKATAGLGTNAPRGYSGFVPAVELEGEVYPGVLADSTGFFRNVGVILHVHKSAFLESQFPDNPMISLPTSYFRYGLGVFYRIHFDKASLKLGFGFNKSNFTIDRSAAMGTDIGFPNVSYRFVDPGARFRYPLGDKLALNLDGRAMVVFASGEIQQRNQYGAGTVFGVEADVNIVYAIGERLSVEGGVRGTGFLLKFKGNGERSDRNGDAMSDVSGAVDRYLGAYVLGGYAF